MLYKKFIWVLPDKKLSISKERSIEYYKINNAQIFNEIVLNIIGQLPYNKTVHFLKECNLRFIQLYKKKETLKGLYYALTPPFSDNYFHLTGALIALFNYYKLYGNIPILIPEITKSWQKDLLHYYSIDYRELKNDTTYYVESCILDKDIYTRLPNINSDVLTNFETNIIPTKNIYITRRNRKPVNETEIIDYLKPLGYNVYDLEKLRIKEQIDLFKNAKNIVAPHGASGINLIYANNFNFTELFPDYLEVSTNARVCAIKNCTYSGLFGKSFTDNEMMVKFRSGENYKIDMDLFKIALNKRHKFHKTSFKNHSSILETNIQPIKNIKPKLIRWGMN